LASRFWRVSACAGAAKGDACPGNALQVTEQRVARFGQLATEWGYRAT